MRIEEENRSVLLIGAVTLCCAVVVGTFALFEPVFGQAPERSSTERRVANSGRGDTPALVPVRVVGAPFVPNVNPRQR